MIFLIYRETCSESRFEERKDNRSILMFIVEKVRIRTSES